MVSPGRVSVATAAGERRRSEAGYTLVGLLVLVAVINIGLAAAAQSLVTVDRRAREAELIWRGRQYARAITCYRQSDAGEPLIRLEQLVDANCLRRLYDEPMSADGEWRILTAQDAADGTLEELAGPPVGPGGVPMGVGEEAEADGDTTDDDGAGEEGLGLGGSSGRQGLGRGSSGRGGLGSGLQLGSGFSLGFGGLGSGDAANRIIGVSSTVDRESLRLYQHRKNYESWLFIGAGAD